MADFRFMARENSSGLLTFRLEDERRRPVAGTDLTSFTLTLLDSATAAVINGRDEQDVLGAGAGAHDVTISSDGEVTWELRPDDNPNLSSLALEQHEVYFDARWNGGRQGLEIAGVLVVENVLP